MLRLPHSDRNLEIFHIFLPDKLSMLLNTSSVHSHPYIFDFATVKGEISTHISNPPMQIILQPPRHILLLKIIQTNPILPFLLPPNTLHQEICQHYLSRRQLSLTAHRLLLFPTRGTAFHTRPAGLDRGREVVDDADLIRVIAEFGKGETFAEGLGAGWEGVAEEDADCEGVAAECPADTSLEKTFRASEIEGRTNRS
jgi:hypothetical protein